jgi:sugar O-acyltransferase (sialic acid O-acetyltransferase NeuD family)
MIKDQILIFGVSEQFTGDIIESCIRKEINYLLVTNLSDSGSSTTNSLSANDLIESQIRIPTILGLAKPDSKRNAKISAMTFNLENWINLIDPTAILPTSIDLGVGIYINAGVIVGSNTCVKNFVTSNRGAVLGHHVEIGEYAFIGPGAIVSGGVTIGADAYIGAGAVIRDGIQIGSNSVIGAGSVVVKNVETQTTVLGNPARPYAK